MSQTKVSKAEAGYRKGREDYKCKLCTMFRGFGPLGTCTAVKGEINAGYVCDYFEPK